MRNFIFSIGVIKVNEPAIAGVREHKHANKRDASKTRCTHIRGVIVIFLMIVLKYDLTIKMSERIFSHREENLKFVGS